MIKGLILKIMLWFFYYYRDESKPNKYLYGVRKDKDDYRDYDAISLVDSVQPLPTKYTLSINPYLFVKNQGKWNSCTGHALATALEISHIVHNTQLKTIELSERYSWFFSRILSGTFPDNKGAYLRDVMKSAQNYGVSPERLCPYINDLINEIPDRFAYSFAKFFKIKFYYRVHGKEMLKRVIKGGYPVIAGVKTTRSFIDDKGEIKVELGERTYGAHAIVIYGFDDDKGCFNCINSWGDGYKDRGIMDVPYEYIDKYGFDLWAFNI